MKVESANRRYTSFISDSARWDGFEFRPGDIIITTPAKCGTTWTQMICGLLVFQTPDFYRPLAEITPWLDMLTRDREEVFADLGAQKHRRFIKTHTPIDGLPWSDDITYISVMRDPRDVGISMDNHLANMNLDSLLTQRAAVAGLDDMLEYFPDGVPTPPETQEERFWEWVEDDTPIEKSLTSLQMTFQHLNVAWPLCERDNVVLLHYADLKSDRSGQMRELAHRLTLEIPETKWPELIDAASFEYMKAHAEQTAPNSTQDLWLSTSDFFRSGKNGQWRDVIRDDASIARYNARVADLTTPERAAWAHRG
jgi:hypothetical protein